MIKYKIKAVKPHQTLRIQVMADETTYWTDNNRQSKYDINTSQYESEIFFANIKLKNKDAEKMDFTFNWIEAAC